MNQENEFFSRAGQRTVTARQLQEADVFVAPEIGSGVSGERRQVRIGSFFRESGGHCQARKGRHS
jgi:hypothetical protein